MNKNIIQYNIIIVHLIVVCREQRVESMAVCSNLLQTQAEAQSETEAVAEAEAGAEAEAVTERNARQKRMLSLEKN